MKFHFLLLLSLASNPLLAQNASKDSRLFDRLDQNQDGRLSREEAEGSEFFAQADRNANGFVSASEARAFSREQRADARKSGETTAGKTEPVFRNDPQVLAKKRAILDQIASVTDGDRRPPNIVLILCDDLGYADTSTYGSKTIPTPNLDALAAAGATFSDAYVTAASCSPSRAGLMTGCYQQRFGFEFNTAGAAMTHRTHRGLDPAAITIADVLNAAGYATGAIGKWHLGTQPQFHPLVRGFDEFYGFLGGAHSFFPATNPEPVFSTIMRDREPLIETEYLTDALAREATNFIDRHADSPFFVYVPFNAVHTPIEATKKYRDRFPRIDDSKRRDYYAMTSALDDGVGKIVACLEEHGISDQTLVIFVNDNGGPTYTGVQSNGPLRLGKLFLFEGGIRVPMVLRWPRVIPQGIEFSGMSSSLDLFPTICSAAGIDLPSDGNVDGVDLLPFMGGKAEGSPHETLFWSNGPNRAIRHGDWKLIQSGDSNWLYDLSNDIGEARNLKKSHPKQLHELENLLDRWQQSMAKPAWPSKPNRRRVIIGDGTYEQNI